MKMNPAYIYFKELDIDKDNNFTLNFQKITKLEMLFLIKNTNM